MHPLLFVASLLLAPPGVAPQAAAPAGSDTPAFYFLLGRHYEGEGQIEQAIAAHRRAIELEPESAELKAELAALYARQDRAADALAMSDAALEKNPANREANRIRGSIYAAFAGEGRPIRPGDDPAQYAARAIAALETTRGEVPDLVVEFMLGRLYLGAKDFARAIPALRRVFEEQPGYGETAVLLSAALQEAGQIAEAITTLETAIEENPRSFRAYVRLGELYDAQSRPKEAAAAYAAAQALNPRADLTLRRAAALLEAGEPAEAKTLLQGVAKKDGRTDPGVVYLLAHAHQRLGDDAAAVSAWREVLAHDPVNANALNSLGYLFAERGERLDEAVQLVQRALKIEPANPSFLDSLGWAYFRQGKLDLAEAPLAEAAARLPENSVILDHLGDLRFRQKRYEDAVRAWERSLAGDGDSIDRRVIEKKLADARGKMRKSKE